MLKNWHKVLLKFFFILGILGGTLLVSGVMSIGASGGHWPLTAWFLHFAMKRSVSTYSLLVDDVPRFTRQMVLRGGGHYELECRQCHGDPGGGAYVGQLTTPIAPKLSRVISEWTDKDLFRIVKHGVKFTGMPAWPSLVRDDEVWAMVAFLREYPTLTGESYSALVYGEKNSEPPKNLHEPLKTCISCHGIDGNGRENAFPKLAGQNATYLEDALIAFKTHKRASGTMELAANRLSEKSIREIAQHYAGQKRISTRITPSDPELIKIGELIARNGIPEKNVASCMRCHGPAEHGGTYRDHFPDLRGQPASYIENQLHLFLKDTRGGGPHVRLMRKAVPQLNKEEIRAVAAYYESLL